MTSLSRQPVTFVTSFKPDMYGATGKHLIGSFRRYCDDSQMFVCTESFTGTEGVEPDPRVVVHDITQDPLLLSWLEKNSDVIPKHLGGEAEPCDCPVSGFGIEEVHRDGCINGWYNRNAARWFRKLVALNSAMDHFPGGRLIWIDSDCRFKSDLLGRTICSWFNGSSGFYFKSPQRRVMESGILGFDLSKSGGELLHEVIERYTSGAFRKDLRWDDGYQFQLAVNRREDIWLVDLAPTALSWHAEVIAVSVVGKYIDHFRGTHGPVLHLMT